MIITMSQQEWQHWSQNLFPVTFFFLFYGERHIIFSDSSYSEVRQNDMNLCVILSHKFNNKVYFYITFDSRDFRTFAESFLPVLQDTRKARIISRSGSCFNMLINWAKQDWFLIGLSFKMFLRFTFWVKEFLFSILNWILPPSYLYRSCLS